MQIFIHDVPVHLTAYHRIDPVQMYDRIIDFRHEELRYTDLEGTILVNKASNAEIIKVFQWLITGYYEKLHGVTFGVTERKSTLKALTDHFHLVEAAGGIVEKDDQVLLIHRRGQWDLPKGKLEKKEGFKDAAVREVEEETGVRVSRREKVASTWHTYTAKGKMVLKRTKWYRMECQSDKDMAPQVKEGIDQVVWKPRQEAAELLAESYKSLEYLFAMYEAAKAT